jgi:histidinol phosphatase-like enzyme
MKFVPGDLVRVRGPTWSDTGIGIVMEVKSLLHHETGYEYVVVTARVGDETHTFSEEDFELVNKIEREK